MAARAATLPPAATLRPHRSLCVRQQPGSLRSLATHLCADGDLAFAEGSRAISHEDGRIRLQLSHFALVAALQVQQEQLHLLRFGGFVRVKACRPEVELPERTGGGGTVVLRGGGTPRARIH